MRIPFAAVHLIGMPKTIQQVFLEDLRSIGHAIIDAQGHLEAKDIDRASSRLSDAKNTLAELIMIAGNLWERLDHDKGPRPGSYGPTIQ